VSGKSPNGRCEKAADVVSQVSPDFEFISKRGKFETNPSQNVTLHDTPCDTTERLAVVSCQCLRAFETDLEIPQ